MNRVVVAVSLLVLASGCADTHQIIGRTAPVSKFGASDTILVGVPDDGMYGADTYRGSGLNTAQIVLAAFAKHTRMAKIGRPSQTFDETLASARQAGVKYLVYPTILHWEDRATEWSAIPDKVEVRIEVIEASSGETVASGVIKGKSGLATFGGDHPQDLLPEPTQEFVFSLY